MKEIKRMTFHLDDLAEKTNWLFFSPDGENLFPVTDDIKQASESLKASPELITAINDALGYLAESIVSELKRDLTDLAELQLKKNSNRRIRSK